jgi:hypothetical protein
LFNQLIRRLFSLGTAALLSESISDHAARTPAKDKTRGAESHKLEPPLKMLITYLGLALQA